MMSSDHHSPITVLIVDDLALQREGYRRIIESQDDMIVIGEAGTARSAVAFVRKEHADVVLMDIRLPDTDGLVTTKRIVRDARVAALGGNPGVVLVTAHGRDELEEAAVKAGAMALVFKDVDPEKLLSTIRAAALAAAERSAAVAAAQTADNAGVIDADADAAAAAVADDAARDAADDVAE
jgi:DNA-binding NarL/FixJ family response regulator